MTYLTKNSVTIVGKVNSTNRVENHLKHGTRAKSSTDDICDSTSSHNVAELSLTAMLALRVSVCLVAKKG